MKTLGQIAYEAGQDATMKMMPGFLDPIPWDEIGPDLQRCHEATAAAIVEHCAKVMCHRCGDGEAPFLHETSQVWCHPNAMGVLVRCASHELRSLIATLSQGQEEDA